MRDKPNLIPKHGHPGQDSVEGGGCLGKLTIHNFPYANLPDPVEATCMAVVEKEGCPKCGASVVNTYKIGERDCIDWACGSIKRAERFVRYESCYEHQIAQLQERLEAWREFINMEPSVPSDRARNKLLEWGELKHNALATEAWEDVNKRLEAWRAVREASIHGELSDWIKANRRLKELGEI